MKTAGGTGRGGRGTHTSSDLWPQSTHKKGESGGIPEQHHCGHAGARAGTFCCHSYRSVWSNATQARDSNNLSFVGSFSHSFIQCMFLKPPPRAQLVLGAGESEETRTVQWLMDATAQWSWECSSLWLRGTGRWALPARSLGAEPPLMLTMRPWSLTGRDPVGKAGDDSSTRLAY